MKTVPMTLDYAKETKSWKYNGIYSFYNDAVANIVEFMDGNHFACVDDDGILIGLIAFGESTRIPTVEKGVYEENMTDFGLKMCPDLCGRGYGTDYVLHGLKFARENLGAVRFRLSVAAFNERAIKVYKRCGFEIEREVTNEYFGNKFYIMRTE